MSERAFLASMKDALTALALAEIEAVAELPEEIKREHALLVRSGQVVCCWDALAFEHPENRAVDALSLISEFRAKVQGLEIRCQADERAAERVAQGLSAYDLTLRRVRR